MKKKYLFLGLSLLLCGGSAWAQTTPGAISSYEDLKQAVANIENVATLETEIATLEEKIKAWDNNEPLQYENKTVRDTSDVYKTIKKFATAIINNQTTNTTEISYYTGSVYNEDEEIDIYTVYMTTPDIAKNITTHTWKTVKASEVLAAKNGTDSNKKNQYKFILPNNEAVKPDGIVYVYSKNNSISYTTSSTLISGVRARSYIWSTPETYITDLDLKSSNFITERTTQEETNAYKQWKVRLEELNTEKTQKENSLKEASSVKTYTITKDITVTDKDLNEKTWPATYTLNGDCYHICLNNQSDALFAANAGTIKNLISKDGSIAVRNTGNGYVDNCIFKATDGTYRVYTDNARTEFNNIETAIYSKRNSFGYDLTNSIATKVTDTNKLYAASYASAANKTKQSFYVNINENNITGYTSTKYPTNNAFIYVEDEVPVTITTENVVANGVCQNAKIVEGKDESEFYIPTNFTAANLNYDRDLKTDVVSVCLPFALTDDIKNTINENLKKDGSNNEMYYYNYKRVNKTTKTVWFGRLSEIKANTPGVLAFTTKCIPGKIFNGLTNVNFVSTEGADLALTATDDVDDQAKRFRGNYKPYQQVADVVQAAGNIGSDVYSFKDNVLVKLNEKARINQFRSFIVYTMDLTQEANLRVRFMDEEGNEVTHIENVNTDRKENSEFKVSGSNGAIEISAEKACDVKVYTTGGALVKAVRVEAGHTSLPVNAGMYIVNKNKVVVK